MNSEAKWYDQQKERNEFLRAMVDTGAFETGSSVVDFLEKPWHWDDEYAIWTGLGRPLDRSDSGWSDFETALDELSVPT